MVAAKKIKVVTVISGLNVGGAEITLLKLLQRLDGRFQSHVVSLSTVGEIGRKIQSLGIHVESLGMHSRRANLWALWRLVRGLRALEPDIVHTWMYHADLLGGLAAMLANVPVVIWGIRNSTLDRTTTKASTRAIVRICAIFSRLIPDRIVSCSKIAEELHVRRGYAKEKLIVVPNGFDVSNFRPDQVARQTIRAELGIAMEQPVVGLIARYDPLKNFRGFFEMAVLLRVMVPRTQFVLAGSNVGWNNAELVQIIDACGVKGATHLLGKRDDVSQIMPALDVLVSASYGEAFPNVLGEAMACGVPCVATNAGDSAYIVGAAGKIVDIGDMKGLARAAAALITAPTSARQALAGLARARIISNFQIDDMVRSYETLYDELLLKA
jgi:glycosyltransferase involved in cell wall biosynthesis